MVSLRAVFGEDAAVLRDENFQILFLANVFPSIGTAVLSPILDALVGPFGTTSSNIGLLISAYTAPGIVVILLTGVIADRWGRKPVIVAGLLFFGIGGTSIAFTTDFRVALLLRFVQGIGFACLSPILIASIGDLYTGGVEATAEGLRFTGSGMAQTVFPLVSGSLVVLAWQYPFFLYALAFPTALLVYLRFDEPTAVAGPRSELAPDGGRHLRDQLRSLRDLVRDRRVYALVVSRCFPSVVWIGFLTYNSIIVVRVLGGTPVQAGLIAAVGSTFFSIAASQSGWITAAFDTRYVPLVGANVALAAGFVATVFAPSVPVAALSVAVVGSGFGITLSLNRSVLTQMAPSTLRGGLVSLAEALGRLASTLTPIALGGVTAAATPLFGFHRSVQVAVVVVSLVAGVGSLTFLSLGYRSSPVDYGK